MASDTNHRPAAHISTKEEILRTIATDLPRWGELGLADPLPDGELPEDAQTADVFAHAAVAPGAVDPVEGLLRSVAEDHKAIAHLLMSGGPPDLRGAPPDEASGWPGENAASRTRGRRGAPDRRPAG